MIAGGIDPGLASTGVAVVELLGQRRRVVAQRTISTKAKCSTFERIRILREELLGFLLPFRPEVLTFEAQLRAAFGHQQRGEANFSAPKALIGVGCAISVANEMVSFLMLPGQPKLGLLELEPATIRKANGQKGNCSKDALRASAPRIYLAWPLELSEHAADAITIAGAGAAQWNVRKSLDNARTSRTIANLTR